MIAHARSVIVALATLSAVPAAAQTAQPAPQLFDDFLFDNAGQPAENFNGFFQWQVIGGSVDLVGGNIPGKTPTGLVDFGGMLNYRARCSEILPHGFAGFILGGALQPQQIEAATQRVA